jgi:hypothetical protein
MNADVARQGRARRRKASPAWADDRRHGGERRDVDPETAPLVDGFLEGRRADARQIPELVAAGAFGQVHRLGHNMKGNGVSYGFPQIGRIGSDLATAAVNADRDWILRLNAMLQAILSSQPAAPG